MLSFRAKMHKIRFRLGLCPRPCWGSLQRSRRPPSWIWGPTCTSNRREGEGGKGRGVERGNRYKMEKVGRERRGKGRGRKGELEEERRCAVGIFNYFRL